MTELQKNYRKVLASIDGDDWDKTTDLQAGHAGVAIILSCLDDGNLQVNHLKKRLPEFSQTDIRTALKNLRASGYFKPAGGESSERRWMVSLTEEEQKGDGVAWALLSACAQGWIKRTRDKKFKEDQAPKIIAPEDSPLRSLLK